VRLPSPPIATVALFPPPPVLPAHAQVVVAPLGRTTQASQKLPALPPKPREQVAISSKPPAAPSLRALKLASLPPIRIEPPSPRKLADSFMVPIVVDPPSYLGARRPHFSIVAEAAAAEIPPDRRQPNTVSPANAAPGDTKQEAAAPGANATWDDAAALPRDNPKVASADAAAPAEREAAPTDLMPREREARPNGQASAPPTSRSPAQAWSARTQPSNAAPPSVAPPDYSPPDYPPPGYRPPEYYAPDYRPPDYRPTAPTWAPPVPVAGYWSGGPRAVTVCSGPGRAVLFTEWNGRWVRRQIVRDNRCNA
jgi:hypothetical protein